MHKEMKGIYPIIASPFTLNGEVDYESLRNEVEFLADHGCQGVTLFGIAGEYYKLSDEESEKMVRIVVETCKRKKIISVVSVTQHATEMAVRQAKYYQECGADGLMLLPPFFMKPDAASIYEHMKQVCKGVKIPVVIQYAPEQTGVSIAPGILSELRNDVETEVYYKIECKPAGGYITSLLAETDGNAKIFIGNAGYQFVECFDRGAIGAMPGASMFDLYLKIYDEYMAGDRDKAKKLHGEFLLPMLNHIRQNVEMIILYEKKILYKRGIIASDYCRKPTFKTDFIYDNLFEEYYETVKPFFER